MSETENPSKTLKDADKNIQLQDFSPLTKKRKYLDPCEDYNGENEELLAELDWRTGPQLSMFECFAQFVDTNSEQLRQEITAHVLSHKEDYRKAFRFLAGGTSDDYLRTMQSNAFQGDEITAYAFCQLFQWNVDILCFPSAERRQIFRFSAKPPTGRTLCLLHSSDKKFRVVRAGHTGRTDSPVSVRSVGTELSYVQLMGDDAPERVRISRMLAPKFVKLGDDCYQAEIDITNPNFYVINKLYRAGFQGEFRSFVKRVPIKKRKVKLDPSIPDGNTAGHPDGQPDVMVIDATQPLPSAARMQQVQKLDGQPDGPSALPPARTFPARVERLINVFASLLDDIGGTISKMTSSPEAALETAGIDLDANNADDDSSPLEFETVPLSINGARRALHRLQKKLLNLNPGPVIFFGFVNRGKSTTINYLARCMTDPEYTCHRNKTQDEAMPRTLPVRSLPESESAKYFASASHQRSKHCIKLFDSDRDVQQFLIESGNMEDFDSQDDNLGLLPTSFALATTTCVPIQILPSTDFKVIIRYKPLETVCQKLENAISILKRMKASEDPEELFADDCWEAMAMLGVPKEGSIATFQHFKELDECTDFVLPRRLQPFLGGARVFEPAGVSSVDGDDAKLAALTPSDRIVFEISRFLIVNVVGPWSHWGLIEEVQVFFPALADYIDRHFVMVDVAGLLDKEEDPVRARYTFNLLSCPFSIFVHVISKGKEPKDITEGLTNAMVPHKLLLEPEQHILIPFLPLDKEREKKVQKIDRVIHHSKDTIRTTWKELLQKNASDQDLQLEWTERLHENGTDLEIKLEGIGSLIHPAFFNVIADQPQERRLVHFRNQLWQHFEKLLRRNMERCLDLFKQTVESTAKMCQERLDSNNNERPSFSKNLRKCVKQLKKLVGGPLERTLTEEVGSGMKRFTDVMWGKLPECEFNKDDFEKRMADKYFENYWVPRKKALGQALRLGSLPGMAWESGISTLLLGKFFKERFTTLLRKECEAAFAGITQTMTRIAIASVQALMEIAELVDHVRNLLWRFGDQLEAVIKTERDNLVDYLRHSLEGLLHDAVNKELGPVCESGFKKHNMEDRKKFLKSRCPNIPKKIFEVVLSNMLNKLISALNDVASTVLALMHQFLESIDGYRRDQRMLEQNLGTLVRVSQLMSGVIANIDTLKQEIQNGIPPLKMETEYADAAFTEELEEWTERVNEDEAGPSTYRQAVAGPSHISRERDLPSNGTPNNKLPKKRKYDAEPISEQRKPSAFDTELSEEDEVKIITELSEIEHLDAVLERSKHDMGGKGWKGKRPA